MLVQPYLIFDGRCEEALNFYKTNIGAEIIDMMRYSQSPVPPSPEMCAGSPGMAPIPPEKIMHASFRVGDTTLMASDGMNTGKPAFQGISLTLSTPTDAETQRLFNALGQGGQVQAPLAKTFFSSSFGMVADRFGVSWMLITMP